MTDHAADCALVLYAGMDTKKPVECDCDVDVADVDDEDDQPTPVSAQPTATITGPAAAALNEYRRAAQDHRKTESRLKSALARLTEELTK